MNRQIKRQLYYRSGLAQKWLMMDLRLAEFYASDKPQVITPEETAYRKRVVDAARRTRDYMLNFKDSDAHLKFMDLVLRGNLDKKEVCYRIGISQGTYTNWLKSMLRVFGAAMGVWI